MAPPPSAAAAPRPQQAQRPSPSASEDARTIVTHSPVPSEIDPPAAVPVADCARRASGLVCVCADCEAARVRLLDRTARKRPPPPPTDDDDTRRARFATPGAGTGTRRPTTVARAGGETETRLPEQAQEPSMTDEEQRIAKMSRACRTILECVGEDPEREGLIKTPERWAKALLFMCQGYQQTPTQVTNQAVFSENHNEMVVVKNIDIHSLCEHHMVPFTGRVHIGYIPNGQIVGLSKLARIAELFARRLQVQERLTRQIADAVVETVQPLGVAVVVECTHFCMVMRGVQKTGAVTTTSSVRGCFESNPKTRAEFFSILHGNRQC